MAMDLLFVTGCMRSGTTMMARWIEEAAPVFATRESAILLVNHWCLGAARFQSRVGEFKPLYVEAFDQLVHRLYRQIGWDGQAVVADKHPYALSDLPLFLEHLNLMFDRQTTANSVVIVYMIRNPFDVIASMRSRTWGDVRGSVLNPSDAYRYWDEQDINNYLSPLSFRLDPLENLVGDEYADRGTHGRWSLKKCCLHWANTLRVLDVPGHEHYLFVDYDRLAEADYARQVRRAIEQRRGIRFSAELGFAPPQDRKPLSESEQAQVQDFLGDSAMAAYQTLKTLAACPGRFPGPMPPVAMADSATP